MADMNVKDWLEAGAYAVAIVSALSGAIGYGFSERKKRIANNRKIIARGWTNEGAINGGETHYITLKLKSYDGDIIGSLESPSLDRPLELHATVGWRSTELRISELRGRSLLPVGIVRVEIQGNENRLRWTLVSDEGGNVLPRSTTLWPFGNAPD